jgi:hypothetical protein
MSKTNQHAVVAFTAVLLLAPLAAPQAAEPVPVRVEANCVAEVTVAAAKLHANPFQDLTVDAVVTAPSGRTIRVPMFWAGGDQWKLRYASAEPGLHVFKTECSDPGDTGLHDRTGRIEVVPYGGGNPLYRRGPVQLSANRRYFAHADGTPFFWLADSWWHAMSSRLTMNGFKTLVADRVKKGFNVIQFAVANPCDIAPFDPRGGNEAGHAWTKDFGTINPAYWDLTDQRVEYLIEQGLMPSIMGTWGYYLHFMGEEKMKRHWRYVIARYGAFPVAWILCGESRLPWYPLMGKGDDGYRQTLRWTELSKTVRDLNSTHRLLGIHPGPALWYQGRSYEPLADYSAIDVYFGMGGHGGGDEYPQVLQCLKTMEKWRAKNPAKLAIIGELCWEGMYGGNCGPFVQRVQFWGAVLGGAPGHCYGTDSLWQMNSRERPFGPSANGSTWGNWPWEEAMHWAGSMHVSVGKHILEKFEWWRFEPHPEWLSSTEEKDDRGLIAAAAGIPGEVRMFYFAKKTKQKLLQLEPNVKYAVTFISPIDGKEYPSSQSLEADTDGSCDVPHRPINQDWVLVLTQPRS